MTNKVYLENSYLTKIKAIVKDKKIIDNTIHLITNRTIFYPHMSGGQPKDEGHINNVQVLDVYKKDDNIIHILSEDIFDEEVSLTIDWNTRFDHMQQHTGQHILSAAFNKLFDANTIGFHLGKDYVYIDIDISDITREQIQKVETFANQILFSNFDIKTYYVNKKQLTNLPIKKVPKINNENIRIVAIDDIDYSPCAGTHNSTTGEVGLIKIRKWEKYKGNIRLEFVCGNRALTDFRWKNDYINSLANFFSTKDDNILNTATKMYEENKLLKKQIKKLNNDLLSFQCNELLSKGKNYDGINLISNIYQDTQFSKIRDIASYITNSPSTLVILGVTSKNKCQIILAKSQNLPDINIKKVFNQIIPLLKGSGGGNPYMVQGGGQDCQYLSNCIDNGLTLIKEQIEKSTG